MAELVACLSVLQKVFEAVVDDESGPKSVEEAWWTRCRIVAVTIAGLTGDIGLSEYYLVSSCRRLGSNHAITSDGRPLCLRHLLEFLSEQAIAVGVRKALSDLSSVCRRRSEMFIVKSHLAAYILMQSRRELRMNRTTKKLS